MHSSCRVNCRVTVIKNNKDKKGTQVMLVVYDEKSATFRNADQDPKYKGTNMGVWWYSKLFPNAEVVMGLDKRENEVIRRAIESEGFVIQSVSQGLDGRFVANIMKKDWVDNAEKRDMAQYRWELAKKRSANK